MSDTNIVTIINGLRAWRCAYHGISGYFYPSHIAPQTFPFRLIVSAMLLGAYRVLVLRNSAYAPKLSDVLGGCGIYRSAGACGRVLGVDPFAKLFFLILNGIGGFITLVHFLHFSLS